MTSTLFAREKISIDMHLNITNSYLDNIYFCLETSNDDDIIDICSISIPLSSHDMSGYINYRLKNIHNGHIKDIYMPNPEDYIGKVITNIIYHNVKFEITFKDSEYNLIAEIDPSNTSFEVIIMNEEL